MIRVCEFEADGIKIKFATMSFAAAEKFSLKSKELLARQKHTPESVPQEEWNFFMLEIVARAMNDIPRNWFLRFLFLITCRQWTPSRVANKFSAKDVPALYLEVLKSSGLRTGEVAAAASPLPKSAAA